MLSNYYDHISIFSLVFNEDLSSIKYAELKKKDASEIGITYSIQQMSMQDPLYLVHEQLAKAAADPSIQGIIVQKPPSSIMPSKDWWDQVIAAVPARKDCDGLTSSRLVLPATARAVLEIAKQAEQDLQISFRSKHAIVIGKSEIVGKPAAHALRTELGMKVELWGKDEMAMSRSHLQTADLVVTATGQSLLFSSSELKPGAVTIDCGAPKEELEGVKQDTRLAFVSPVPGGVGPMTRVCLLENLLDLCDRFKEVRTSGGLVI